MNGDLLHLVYELASQGNMILSDAVDTWNMSMVCQKCLFGPSRCLFVHGTPTSGCYGLDIRSL